MRVGVGRTGVRVRVGVVAPGERVGSVEDVEDVAEPPRGGAVFGGTVEQGPAGGAVGEGPDGAGAGVEDQVPAVGGERGGDGVPVVGGDGGDGGAGLGAALLAGGEGAGRAHDDGAVSEGRHVGDGEAVLDEAVAVGERLGREGFAVAQERGPGGGLGLDVEVAGPAERVVREERGAVGGDELAELREGAAGLVQGVPVSGMDLVALPVELVPHLVAVRVRVGVGPRPGVLAAEQAPSQAASRAARLGR
nr:hypothetical protein GCM10025732_33620 [Glycomyces mayteni]